ncbi:MAG: DUF488 domain-containing protein [Limisphaerales bacterium]
MIQIKRVYAPAAKSDGKRFLVERLWPRGIKKEALHMTAWLKEVAPSNELRQWFNHDPTKWKEFQRRYRAELNGKPEVWPANKIVTGTDEMRTSNKERK